MEKITVSKINMGDDSVITAMKSKVYEKDNYKVIVYGTPDLSLIPKDKIDLFASVLEAIICEMVKEDNLNDRTGSDKA